MLGDCEGDIVAEHMSSLHDSLPNSPSCSVSWASLYLLMAFQLLEYHMVGGQICNQPRTASPPFATSALLLLSLV